MTEKQKKFRREIFVELQRKLAFCTTNEHREKKYAYTVSIHVGETQIDTFSIKAPDFATAKLEAMDEAIERGYEIDVFAFDNS